MRPRRLDRGMKIFNANVGSEDLLVCQYAPSIQFQSALDTVSKEYFRKVLNSNSLFVEINRKKLKSAA
jgi:hypothetical protein